MTLKGIIDEDFINYRVPSMTLMFPKCSFKCGNDLCQNKDLNKIENTDMTSDKICERYVANPITESVVLQGLEPMDSFADVLDFITTLRKDYQCDDDVVIYSGYNKDEISNQIYLLRQFPNIVMKYGRYIPEHKPHYDEVLGVYLISDNQYAERIS